MQKDDILIFILSKKCVTDATWTFIHALCSAENHPRLLLFLKPPGGAAQA